MNAVLMSLVAIPVYIWARRLVSPVYAVAGRRPRPADADLRLRQRGDDREPRVPGRHLRAVRDGARARAPDDPAPGARRRRDRARVRDAAPGARAVPRAADGNRAQGAARCARGAPSVAGPLPAAGDRRYALTLRPHRRRCARLRGLQGRPGRVGARRCSASTAASRRRATRSRRVARWTALHFAELQYLGRPDPGERLHRAPRAGLEARRLDRARPSARSWP